MKRVQLQLPPDADEAVVSALRLVASEIAGDEEVKETADEAEGSYSLTVHVFPDPPTEG